MDQKDVVQLKIDFEASEKLIRDRSAMLIKRSTELTADFSAIWFRANNIVLLYRKDNHRYK